MLVCKAEGRLGPLPPPSPERVRVKGRLRISNLEGAAAGLSESPGELLKIRFGDPDPLNQNLRGQAMASFIFKISPEMFGAQQPILETPLLKQSSFSEQGGGHDTEVLSQVSRSLWLPCIRFGSIVPKGQVLKGLAFSWSETVGRG